MAGASTGSAATMNGPGTVHCQDENGRPRGFVRGLVGGLLIQAVMGLPAGIAQAVGVIPGVGGEPLGTRLLLPLISLPFNIGGVTVRAAFEALVGPLEPWVGHRSATVASNVPFYLLLLSVQVLAVTLLFGGIGRRRALSADLRAHALALAVLANSLANVRWPWWGS